MTSRVAQALVFVTSGLVLVLEIIAARIVAPYVGVSLESFTAIIGTVLAGIAAGSAIGGRLADQHNASRMLGPAIIAGGVLSWLSLPIVRVIGPVVGSSSLSTVVLVAAAFLLPAAVVSSVSPMVAKLTLGSVSETGTVVGSLSAAGTVGALAGTFLTGFVLVAVLPTRVIVLLIGAALIVIGVAVSWKHGRSLPTGSAALGGIVALAALLGTGGVCDRETAYYCVRVEAAADAPNERSLWLDDLRHGFVDLDDATHHDIRYVRIMVDVVAAMSPGALDVVHIGGGAFALPRHVEAERPGSDQVVFEIDSALVGIAEEQLGLVQSDRLTVETGDARLRLAELPDDGLDLVIGDAFGSEAVPWHLTTVEVAAEIERSLRPNGIYAVNLIDGDDGRFVAAQLATLSERFEYVAVVEPPGDASRIGTFNRVVLASDVPLPEIVVDGGDGILVLGDPWGDGKVLTDDFAPVDQLIG